MGSDDELKKQTRFYDICHDKCVIVLSLENCEVSHGCTANVESAIWCACNSIVASHALYCVFTPFIDVAVDNRCGLAPERCIKMSTLFES
jgi:hypothetical protein